jgi:hypothetical protein
MTKLASTLPGGDANGLTAIARRLIEHPHDVHVVIALVDCKKVTTDNDNGESVPTARVRRVEVVHRDDKAAANRMLLRALEQRTGAVTLPFDHELRADLEAAFGVDAVTGEIGGQR